jgi:iron complex outermembrane recepter protein
MTRRVRLCAGAGAVSLIAVTSASTQAVGATAAAAADVQQSAAVEEVIVTARRQEENQQTVPVSITAFSAKALEAHTVTQVADLGQLTPSLAFTQSQYGSLGVLVSLRGQRANDLVLSQTPSVGVYVDDVYQSSTMGLSALNLEDAASVEVLKGPQGTLYGRNTTGGAVKIATPLPSYEDHSGQIRAGAGNENDVRVFGAVSMPLIHDQLALRLAANYERNDGFGRDVLSNAYLGNIDLRSVQATLRAKPTEKLEVIARGSYVDERGGGNLIDLVAIVPGGALNTIAAFQLGKPLNAAGLAQALAFLRTNYLDPAGRERYYNGPTSQSVRQSMGSLAVQYEVNDELTLKSITAVEHYEDRLFKDDDATPFRTVDGNLENQLANQVTEELQFTGTLLEKHLNYTGGYYYYNLTGTETALANVLAPLVGQVILNDAHIRDHSNSGYLHATYNLLPSLRVTGGLRYTSESDPLTSFNQTSNKGLIACQVPVQDRVDGQCEGIFTHKDSDLSYTAGLDYDAFGAILLYAKTSRGFKAGGVNQRGTANGGYNDFQPEQVNDYEIGEKAEFWDHRIRLNMAAYLSDYTNIQRSVLVHGVTGTPATAIQNAASARIRGVEAEFTIRPVTSLTLSAEGSYTHAKYGRYTDTISGADLSHNVFPALPTWEGSISANYVQQTFVGALSGTVDVSYQSKVNYNPDNNILPGSSAAFPDGTAAFTTQDGYALANARLELTIDRADMTVALWARNLFDKRYFAGGEDQSRTLGLVYMQEGRPRTVGVEVTKHF